MKKNFFALTLALALIAGMTCALLPPLPAAAATEVVLKFAGNNYIIEDAADGMVRVVEIYLNKPQGGAGVYDPKTTTFVLTGRGGFFMERIDLTASVDLTLKLRNVSTATGSDGPPIRGTGGNVHLILEGDSELSRSNNIALDIPAGKTYTVSGTGSLTLAKGSIGAGVPHGTLRMLSGTINCANGVCNADMILDGGIFAGRMALGTTLQDAEGNVLYQTLLDFSDPSCEPYLDDKRTIMVNGERRWLDENRKCFVNMQRAESLNICAVSGGIPVVYPLPPDMNHGTVVKVSVEKQKVWINLKHGSARIVDSNTPNTVRYIQEVGGQEQTSIEYDPYATLFIFTTDGEESNASIRIETPKVYTVMLSDCKLKRAEAGESAFSFVDNAHIISEGKNQFWGSDTGCGIQIPWQKNCTVSGQGLLSVKGGAAIGNYDAEVGAFAETGEFALSSGTVQIVGEDCFNAVLRYTGGFLNGDGPDSGVDGNNAPIYRVPLDFSDASFASHLRSNNIIRINAQNAYLDENKRTCIYLPKGTEKVSLSSLPISGNIEYSIPAVQAGGNPNVKVILVGVNPPETTSNTAILSGIWVGNYNKKRILQYRIGSSNIIHSIDMRNPSETTYLLTRLKPDTEYKCRAVGTSDAHMIEGEWLTFRTQKLCTLTLNNGRLTSGTPVSGNQFNYGSEISVTADTLPEGHIFIGWYDGDELLTNSRNYSVTLYEDRLLTAKTVALADLTEIESNVPADNLQITTSDSNAFPWRALPDSNELCTYDIDYNGAVTELDFQITVPEGGLQLYFDWWITNAVFHRAELLHNGKTIDSFTVLISDKNSEILTKGVYLPEGENTIVWRLTVEAYVSFHEYSSELHVKNLRLALPESVTVTAVSNNPAWGTVSPAVQTVKQNEETVLRARPEPGYYLRGWKNEAENLLSRDQSCTIYPTESGTYTAEFAKSPDYSPAVKEGEITLTAHPGTDDVLWTLENDNSLRVGDVGNGTVDDPKESVLASEITVPKGESKFLEFEYKAPLAAMQNVRLEVNGQRHLLSSYPSFIEWEIRQVILGEGTHEVKWIFRNSADDSQGPNAWFRNFRLYDVTYYTVTAESNNEEYGTVRLEGGPLYPIGKDIYLGSYNNPGYYLKHWLINGVPYKNRRKGIYINVLEDMKCVAVFGNTAEDFASIVDEESQDAVTFTETGTRDCSWLPVGDGTAYTHGGDAYSTYDLHASVKVPEGAQRRFSFAWKVSAGPADTYSFFVDGVENAAISGSGSGWQSHSVMLEPGEHTVEWRHKVSSPGKDLESYAYLRGVSLSMVGDGKVSAVSSDTLLGTASVTMKDGSPVVNPVASGSEVTFTAQPNLENFGVFLHWTDKNGVIVSDSQEFNAVVDGNLAYTAQFSNEHVYYDSETNSAVVVLSADIPSATLIIAAYDANGVLVSHNIQENQYLQAGKGIHRTGEAFTPVEDGKVKVFLWEDIAGMKPIPLNKDRE